MKLKPKTLVDIKRKGSLDSFSARPRRINLFSAKKPAAFLAAFLKYPLAVLLVIGASFTAKVAAPIVAPGTMAQTIAEERAKLEAELKAYEDQIVEYQKTINEYSKRGASLSGEINILNSKINKLNLQIRAATLSISKLDSEIKQTTSKITLVQGDINSNKTYLTDTIRDLYLKDQEEMLHVLLESEQLSDFFGEIHDLGTLKDAVRETLQELVTSHKELVEERENLSLQLAAKAKLKAAQDRQRASIVTTRTDKNTLLNATKGKQAEYQKYLADARKKAAEIRSRIFQFLGGGQLSFESAYGLARLAQSATGVRAAFILAILDHESALGKNVGRCDYRTAMHPTRDIPPFLQIIAELGLQKELAAGSLKVSCANADGAYGGAMGPAQFIPSTWALYKNRIGQASGNIPPSPWRNSDAVTATAIYLSDLMDACTGYSGIAQERCAAARYYSGSRWRNHLWGYGAAVVNKAERYQDDIDLLESQR